MTELCYHDQPLYQRLLLWSRIRPADAHADETPAPQRAVCKRVFRSTSRMAFPRLCEHCVVGSCSFWRAVAWRATSRTPLQTTTPFWMGRYPPGLGRWRRARPPFAQLVKSSQRNGVNDSDKQPLDTLVGSAADMTRRGGTYTGTGLAPGLGRRGAFEDISTSPSIPVRTT